MKKKLTFLLFGIVLLSGSVCPPRQQAPSLAVNTGGEATLFSLWGGRIAFSTVESDVGQAPGRDLNSDGDFTDRVARYWEPGADALRNTGAETISDPPAISENIIAFLTLEMDVDQLGLDLNGDADRNDTIVRYFDATTQTLFNTGAEAVSEPQVFVDSSLPPTEVIAFASSEAEVGSQGRDLNGDGDRNDTVLRYYDVIAQQIVNTGIEVSDGFVLHGKLLGVAVDESVVGQGTIGTDLNNDGDREDTILQVFDIPSQTAFNTRAEVSGPLAAWDPVIAFNTFEMDAGPAGQDLNGDGDRTEDTVVRYYDNLSGTVISTRAEAAADPVVRQDIIAFPTLESTVGQLGQRLNADGDFDDLVIRYYDTSSREIVNTGGEATGGAWTDGVVVAFSSLESEVGGGEFGVDLNFDFDFDDVVVRYFDTRARVLQNTGAVASGGLSVWQGFIGFITREQQIVGNEPDLNGDQVFDDSVVRIYDTSTGDLINTRSETLTEPVANYGAVFAFTTLESSISVSPGRDLNADFDFNDTVVRFVDAR